MILDSLANASAYAALGTGVARALEFLSRPETARLEPRSPGAQNSLVKPIEGDNVFALVQRYRPRPRRELFWEAHRKYLDVQCLFHGAETMGWAPLQVMGVKQPYDEERDFTVLEPLHGGAERHALFFAVQTGMFTVFFPQDAHMPGIATGDEPNAEIKKIVVKVRV